MRLYLSGVIERRKDFDYKGGLEKIINLPGLHILQTFYLVAKDDEKYQEMCGDFLMDSGAFSFLNSPSSHKTDILEYAKKYANYVKKNNIDNFIELDIDGVFGIDKYLDCLHILQDIVGAEPIRVFHIHRGKEYYEELVRKFDRICIGGIAIGSIKTSEYSIFDWFCETAHKNNCKVHALGMGSGRNIRRYNFDSTDSATWLTSERNGHIHRFNGHEIVKLNGSEQAPPGMHLGRVWAGEVALKAWAQYSNYLDTL